MIAKTKTLTIAASYIRMSSAQQEKSPKQQRDEIDRLAVAENCRIAFEFSDESITGDSGPERRPGFQAMLEAAERGEFSTLLLYDGDRLGRFDSLDGAAYWNRLRRAGIRIVTVTDGAIDLDTFEGRVVHAVKQEGRHAYLRDLSRKVLRGQVENARAGNSNGGPARFGLDRVLVGPDGNMVRRLAPGERVKMKGHVVRIEPTTDTAILATVRYIFRRFADSDIGYRKLAYELNAKGYAGPRGNGWHHAAVGAILQNPLYAGANRWGAKSVGRYHTTQAGAIVDAGGNGGRTPEDALLIKGACRAIIDRKTWLKVQRKIAGRVGQPKNHRIEYPLSGLLFCKHCGQPLYGERISRRPRGTLYEYSLYGCSTYRRMGPQNAAGCGHYTIRAAQIEGFLADQLRKVLLAVPRDELIKLISQEMKRSRKDTKADAKRLQQRLEILDAEVGRLVRAIRTIDAPELVEELATVRADREVVKLSLAQTTTTNAPGGPSAAAEQLAGEIWALGEAFAGAPPEALRDLFRQLVRRIDVEWTIEQGKAGHRRCTLVGGKAKLADAPALAFCGQLGATTRRGRSRQWTARAWVASARRWRWTGAATPASVTPIALTTT